MKISLFKCITMLLAAFFLACSVALAQEFHVNNGSMVFQASTQIEQFNGTSTAVSGSINLIDGRFRFEVELDSIRTGNSTRDRKMREDHFETDRFPKAVFEGVLSEIPNRDANSAHQVNGRGIFDLHGVKQNMEISGVLHFSETDIRIEASFETRLSDFNIKTPRFLFVRVRDEINVIVSMDLSEPKD